MPFYHDEDATKFKQDPVCTSHLEWDSQHKDTPRAPAPVCGKDGGTITTPPESKQTAYALGSITDPPESAILDGTTLTFPSIYLSANGVVFVKDECGIVGEKYTNPIIAVRPGGLSTLSFSKFFDIAYGATTGLFDPALPKSCWTYGAGDPLISSFMQPDASNTSISSLTTTTIYTEGYPHWPFLRPPDEMFEFDPIWKKSCRYWHTAGNQHYAPSFGIFDPPRMLTPAASMGPPTSTPTITTTRKAAWITPTPSASPGAFGSPGTPTSTLQSKATQSIAQSSGDRSDSLSKASIDDPPSPTRTNAVSDTPQNLAQGSVPSPTTVVVGGSKHEIVSDPVYTIERQTLSAGGPTVTIDNVPYSLDKSAAVLVSGTRSIILASPSSTSQFSNAHPGTFTVDNSDAVNIAQTSRPDDPPTFLISGSDPPASGASVVIPAGATFSVAKPQISHPILHIGGHAYTADPRPRIQIGSTAIVAGGLPVTIDGSRYSLAPSATELVVGSQNISIGVDVTAIPGPEEVFPSLSTSATSSSFSAAAQGQAVITVASHRYTCHQNSPCTISSQVLRPNGSITVGADKVVYGEGGIDVVRESKVVVTPSKGEVKTSHISGLTPIGEETGTAPAAAAGGTGGADQSGGGRGSAIIGKKWIWLDVAAALMVEWLCV
ncbi:MAG: hypothetical protein Q9186_007109 [Xanthomendoza sp. 1 TL-2023]